jgi:hypothetical protein
LSISDAQLRARSTSRNQKLPEGIPVQNVSQTANIVLGYTEAGSQSLNLSTLDASLEIPDQRTDNVSAQTGRSRATSRFSRPRPTPSTSSSRRTSLLATRSASCPRLPDEELELTRRVANSFLVLLGSSRNQSPKFTILPDIHPAHTSPDASSLPSAPVPSDSASALPTGAGDLQQGDNQDEQAARFARRFAGSRKARLDN